VSETIKETFTFLNSQIISPKSTSQMFKFFSRFFRKSIGYSDQLDAERVSLLKTQLNMHPALFLVIRKRIEDIVRVTEEKNRMSEQNIEDQKFLDQPMESKQDIVQTETPSMLNVSGHTIHEWPQILYQMQHGCEVNRFRDHLFACNVSKIIFTKYTCSDGNYISGAYKLDSDNDKVSWFWRQMGNAMPHIHSDNEIWKFISANYDFNKSSNHSQIQYTRKSMSYIGVPSPCKDFVIITGLNKVEIIRALFQGAPLDWHVLLDRKDSTTTLTDDECNQVIANKGVSVLNGRSMNIKFIIDELHGKTRECIDVREYNKQNGNDRAQYMMKGCVQGADRIN
jgi:hypothetical protein